MSDNEEVQEVSGEGATTSCRLVFGGRGVCVRIYCVGFEGSECTSVIGSGHLDIGGSTYMSIGILVRSVREQDISIGLR